MEVDFSLSSSTVFPWCTSSLSSSSDDDLPLLYYDLDADDGSVLGPIVDIVSDPVLYSNSYSIDPTSHYLYALDLCLQEMQSNCSTFYTETAVFPPGPLLLAHMDVGSMANTTNQSDYLWGFSSLHGSNTTLCVADDMPHHPTGVGYLKVLMMLGLPGFLLVHTFYTPSLLATILSPASITSDAGCISYTSFAKLDGQDCCLMLHGSPSVSDDIVFPLQFCHGLLFTHALIAPLPACPSASLLQCSCQDPPSPTLPTALPVQHLTQQQLSHLWHQCLGHISWHSVADMHWFALGIPKISIPHNIDQCPVCLASKIHHALCGHEDSRHASQCYQGLSIDFGFFVQ